MLAGYQIVQGYKKIESINMVLYPVNLYYVRKTRKHVHVHAEMYMHFHMYTYMHINHLNLMFFCIQSFQKG